MLSVKVFDLFGQGILNGKYRKCLIYSKISVFPSFNLNVIISSGSFLQQSIIPSSYFFDFLFHCSDCMTKTNCSSQIFVQGIFRFYEAKGVLPEDPEDFSVRKCSTYRENLFSTGIQHLAVHSFRKLFLLLIPKRQVREKNVLFLLSDILPLCQFFF